MTSGWRRSIKGSVYLKPFNGLLEEFLEGFDNILKRDENSRKRLKYLARILQLQVLQSLVDTRDLGHCDQS